MKPEVRAFVTTKSMHNIIECSRFTRFLRWPNLISGLAALISKARSVKCVTDSHAINLGNNNAGNLASPRKPAEIIVIRSAQHEAFADEIELLTKQKTTPLSKGCPLSKLNPIVNENGILRVGGQLSRAELTDKERHPIIIPGLQLVTSLLVKHHHDQTKHQGRHFTYGRIREVGYQIIGTKRLVNRVIHKCVTCRKLRGRLEHQKMADLPNKRLPPVPPFTYVGLDVFRPWQVVTRCTRGGTAKNKHWAVMFMCLTVRAVHIEIIEAMDTSSFLNALQRFLALRGPVSLIHSDCRTNFTRHGQSWQRLLKR